MGQIPLEALPPPNVEEYVYRIGLSLAERNNVTPDAVLKVLRQHLFPMLTATERLPLEDIRRPTWRDLAALFPEYAFLAGPENVRLHAVAFIIRNSVELFSGRRHPGNVAQNEEVSGFLLMRRQMRQSVDDICRTSANNDTWLYRFCRLCWRRSAPSGSLCPEHAANKDASGSYRQAWRQRDRFRTAINEIFSRELMEFHNADLSGQVLYRPGEMSTWLREYRPHVSAFLGLGTKVWPDDELIPLIIANLHTIQSDSHQTQQDHDEVGRVFLQRPDLLWPVLIRAEAWLQVRATTREKWGGARSGAGRRPG